MADTALPPRSIDEMIMLVRGQKVMIDHDLAELYGVETRILNRNVKRNIESFPPDFMFQLSSEEVDRLRCQSGISSLRSQIGISNRGGRRYRPYAFTEQGVAMLSSVSHRDQWKRVKTNMPPKVSEILQLLNDDGWYVVTILAVHSTAS